MRARRVGEGRRPGPLLERVLHLAPRGVQQARVGVRAARAPEDAPVGRRHAVDGLEHVDEADAGGRPGEQEAAPVAPRAAKQPVTDEAPQDLRQVRLRHAGPRREVRSGHRLGGPAGRQLGHARGARTPRWSSAAGVRRRPDAGIDSTAPRVRENVARRTKTLRSG